MPSPAEITAARQQLEEVWQNPPARNGKFGNALKGIAIRNVRGLFVDVEFQSAVTAIGGINGTGKTTVLQACSAAYTESGSGRRQFTLGRWIGPALGGESPPISPPAEIIYSFWDASPGIRVPYIPQRTRWGYPRRGNPARNVEFVGIATFSPRIERQDRTFQNRSRLNVVESVPLKPRTVESISRILGTAYEAGAIHTVSVANAKWTDEIAELTRRGHRYTEGHMGAGEQKLVRLVRYLEDLPERSLVLLEEPELTLHPDAQYGLAWYLIALARRCGHQIIIGTHSHHIFEALPREARIVLTRDGAGVAALHSVHHLNAAREMTRSVRSNKDLLFVEDDVAKRFLTEVCRQCAPDLLKHASIVPIGSATDVQRMVSRLRSQGIRAVGIRDPDQGEAQDQGLFALPGDAAPESLLLDPANLCRAELFISGVAEAADRASVRGVGHAGNAAAKRVFSGLCYELTLEEDLIADRLTLAWLSAPECRADAERLVERVREALNIE